MAKWVSYENPSALYVSLEHIARLSGYERADQSKIITRIVQILADDQTFDYQNLLRLSTATRRFFVTRVMLKKPNKLTDLAKAFGLEPEPLVRYYILKGILAEPDRQDFALSVFENDKSLRLKMTAAQYLVAHNDPQFAQNLLSYAASASGFVRSLVRGAVGTEQNIDFAALYRANIAQKKHLRGSILGLGETGTAADADIVKPFLTAPEPFIVTSALHSIARLDLKTLEASIYSFIASDQHSISACARRIALSSTELLTLHSKVEEVLVQTNLPHVQINCILILAAANKWDAIYYILAHMPISPAAHDACDKTFSIWDSRYNRVYTTPSKAQLHRIDDVLKQHYAGSTDPRICRLRFSVDKLL